MALFSNCACCTPALASTGPAIGRRKFIAGGIAALGLGSAGAPAVRAQGAKTKIDVHHHFVAPDHREYLSKRKVNAPKWSAQMSIENMDQCGIATSVLSPATPGTWWGEAEDSRKMNRIINDYGANLVRDHPGRFGLFATISPTPTAA